MDKQPEKGQPECYPKPNSNKLIYKFDKRVEFEVDPKYRLEKLIGRGAYAMVALGENIETKKKVAIKQVEKLFDRPEDAKRELREIKILKFLKHRNIVSLLDIMRIEDEKDFNKILLVMEFVQIDLKRAIYHKNNILNEAKIKYILFQILDGLQYMHSADILHRDLKPDNILIDTQCNIKIADMNLARKEDINPFTKYVVTRPYRPLEVIICSRSYTKAIDIWSVGCIFAEMIGKTVLFSGDNCMDQLNKFVAVLGKPDQSLYVDIDPMVRETFQKHLRDLPNRGKTDWKLIYPNVDDVALDLLDHMLVYDPKTRYTAEQCLNHPYFQQQRKKRMPKKCQTVFDFSFDDIPMEIDSIRSAIYEVSESFNPDSTLALKRERSNIQPEVELTESNQISKTPKI